MKFKLTNFGRIRTADIALNGITVIAGPNGSGKSTISRALFTWNNFLRQVGGELLKERLTFILEGVRDVLIQCGLPKYRALALVPAGLRIRSIEKFLDLEFWHQEGRVCEWLESLLSDSRFLFLAEDNRDDLRSILITAYPQICHCAVEGLRADESELVFFILERYFTRAFDGQVGTLFDSHAESSFEWQRDDQEPCLRCTFSGVKVVSGNFLEHPGLFSCSGLRMFYLEPRHLLDEIALLKSPRTRMRQSFVRRYSVEKDLSLDYILTHDLDAGKITFAQNKRLEPIREELAKIVGAIRGEIDRDEKKLVFKDADLPGDKSVSLMNVASGVKSMAAIIRGLRNDSIHPGDFLIIDEPESNLHPEWQLSFAKFLVLLHARFDMRILLNTHSPYFLKAVEVYSDEYEQGEDCEYYNMVKFANGQYDAQCVTECRQDVFKAMSAPFSRLMHGEHYERSL